MRYKDVPNYHVLMFELDPARRWEEKATEVGDSGALDITHPF
jgi:hypothetical protein